MQTFSSSTIVDRDNIKTVLLQVFIRIHKSEESERWTDFLQIFIKINNDEEGGSELKNYTPNATRKIFIYRTVKGQEKCY